jgi:hypothetical protein
VAGAAARPVLKNAETAFDCLLHMKHNAASVTGLCGTVEVRNQCAYYTVFGDSKGQPHSSSSMCCSQLSGACGCGCLSKKTAKSASPSSAPEPRTPAHTQPPPALVGLLLDACREARQAGLALQSQQQPQQQHAPLHLPLARW